MLLSFLENTWFLWWVLAVVIILRWFHHAMQEQAEGDDPQSEHARSAPRMMFNVSDRNRRSGERFSRQNGF
jgi:hypothetical protein